MNITKKSSAERKKSTFLACEAFLGILFVDPSPAHTAPDLFGFFEKSESGQRADGGIGVHAANAG